MLQFDTMSDAQRLAVLDPDFRAFLVRHYPGLRFKSFLLEVLSDRENERLWLDLRAAEYVSDLGITPKGSGSNSFALSTLVAFHIGRLASSYRMQQAADDAEGLILDVKFEDEYNQLLVQFDLIIQWARDVYGMKIPS